MGTVLALIAAIGALITAITGLISALRAHTAINSEVKPEVEQNKTGLADAQQAIREIRNGYKP